MNTEIDKQLLMDRATELMKQDAPSDPHPSEPAPTMEDAPQEAEVLLNKDKVDDSPKEDVAEKKSDIPADKITPEETLSTDDVIAEKTEPVKKTWLDEYDTPIAKPEIIIPAEIEQKVKAFDTLTSDPFIESYIAEKRDGGSALTFLKKMSSSQPISVDGKTDREIYEINVTRFGLNKEEIEAEMEHFDSLSPYQKKQAVDNSKVDIEKYNNSLLDKFGEVAKTGRAKAEQEQNRANEAIKTMENLTKELEGMNYRGVVLDKERLDKIKDHVVNVNAFKKPDGTYDIKEAIQYAIFKLYGKDLEKVVKQGVIEKANKEKKEIIDAITRPSKNISGANKGQKITDKEMTDAAAEHLKKRYQNQF